MNGEKVVVTKSTVPVGTALKVKRGRSRRTTVAPGPRLPATPSSSRKAPPSRISCKPDRVVVGVR